MNVAQPIAHPIIVQKYGGSSLKDPEAILRVAGLIKERTLKGARVCVVVSAMGKTTDVLLERAKEITDAPPRRELDMLLTCGERASTALLAMALEKIGVSSISFTGSQCGIITSDNHTDARILEVRPYRVRDELDRGRCVIVAGFQGVSYRKEITTLGRGGSDTTAVALAAALDADACEIYSDVDGVYSADPRVVKDAQKLVSLSYEEMQEFASAGAKVLNAQAVQFAKENNIALFARKTGDEGKGTVIRLNAPKEPGAVRGVAHVERLIVLKTDDLTSLLQTLGDAQITARQVHGEGSAGEVIIDPENAHAIDAVLEKCRGVSRIERGAVSLIGRGMLDDPTVLARALSCAEGELLGVSSSSYRVTLFVPSEKTQALTQRLHKTFVNN